MTVCGSTRPAGWRCAPTGRVRSRRRDRSRGAACAVGDALLVHAGVGDRAARRRGRREVRRRVPRRRARARRGGRDPLPRRARPPLQGDGGLRRAHPLDLQVRRRRPAAVERRARPRARLPGLRDPDGPRRRRDRLAHDARRDLHLLRRHDARAGLEGDAARREGRRRRRADGLLAARRASDRQGEPRPRGRVLRDRLRDDGAVDGADAQARAGRGHPELLVHVQPRDDRPASAGAARVARPAARRLHRPGSRLDDRGCPAVRVHPGRLRKARRDRGLRAARHPAVRSR